MRVLLDTNVIVSAVTTRGLCADVFRAVLSAHELVTCAKVLQEVRRILSMKFLVPEQIDRAEYQELIGQEAILAEDLLLTCRTSPSRTRMTQKSWRRPSAPGRGPGTGDHELCARSACKNSTGRYRMSVDPRGFLAPEELIAEGQEYG